MLSAPIRNPNYRSDGIFGGLDVEPLRIYILFLNGFISSLKCARGKRAHLSLLRVSYKANSFVHFI